MPRMGGWGGRLIDQARARLSSSLGSSSVSTVGDRLQVEPRNAEGVALACRIAGETGLTLGARGHGTWQPDVPADLSVCTKALVGVDASPADLVATVGAGIRLDELQDSLAEAGLWLPLDPPGSLRRSVGSVIATATAGPLGAGFGPVRDHVLGCTFVTADGRVIQTGGRVVKNVAGFDLTKLQVGGFGEFGILTSLHLRLRALPPADVTLLASGSRNDLRAASKSIVMQNLQPSALELIAPEPGSTSGWTLALRTTGSRAAVDSVTSAVKTASGLDWQIPDANPLDWWREQAERVVSRPLTVRGGVSLDRLDRAMDLLDLETGWTMSVGCLSGTIRWSGETDPSSLTKLREAMAGLESPLIVERAPAPVLAAAGRHGAYRQGVATIVGNLRTAFDPAGRMIAFDGAA